jgi:hypothetical protein
MGASIAECRIGARNGVPLLSGAPENWRATAHGVTVRLMAAIRRLDAVMLHLRSAERRIQAAQSSGKKTVRLRWDQAT